MSERVQMMVPFTRDMWDDVGHESCCAYVVMEMVKLGAEHDTVTMTFEHVSESTDADTMWRRPAQVIVHAEGYSPRSTPSAHQRT